MAHPPPVCISKEFLAQCLQNAEGKEGIEVKNVRVSPAVYVGNNFSSCISRVSVEYTRSQTDVETSMMSLIVKVEPSESACRQLQDDYTFCERMFYNKVVPAISKLSEVSFIPKTLSSLQSTTLVLEDLVEKGFVMPDRLKMLDFHHCRLYVTAVACLHAASVVLHKRNPTLVEAVGKEKRFYDQSFFEVTTKHSLKLAMESIINGIKGSKNFEHCSEIIEHSPANIWEMLLDAHKVSEGLNVLNHGDSWTPNLMFSYDAEGAPSQVKLLDFQILKYGSPAHDLVFFIWTSANHNVRSTRLPELYQIYLDAFNQRLEDLDCSERLTMDILMGDVFRLSPLSFTLALLWLPFMLSPIEFRLEYVIPQEGGKQMNIYKQYYSESYCTEHLPHVIEHLDSAGVFDYFTKYGQ